MRWLWSTRSKWRPALSELGCGLLTVLLFTAPLWVLTIGWRGPRVAFLAIAAMVLALVAVAAFSRLFRRR